MVSRDMIKYGLRLRFNFAFYYSDYYVIRYRLYRRDERVLFVTEHLPPEREQRTYASR